MVVLDVDGVLTDGKLYYTSDGSITRAFNVHDGMGIVRALSSGIIVAALSGRDDPSVRRRMDELGVELLGGSDDKLERYEDLLRKHGLKDEEVAYIGDDINDIPVMRRVGVPVAVADARPEVKAIAFYVTHAKGGEGAVREVLDMVLNEKGA
ncbi:MAG: 3-deoxy-D-manno-octulosonate 8-phosphate phosphatase [Candidatus Latescibacterota bacterium]|nr:MAG: 3-deoxy-D-manno-octulosonate 8-phosphate phosphatase [Candidatus Latescibacterota bacterium]RKY73997.1 MAG: 3-deoxy-D-manno-octulosonate 8-phosphate phosphatase [Candidatus Latescibacterota bacterium]HDH99938.1 HAD family hydrolase [Bacillota bacterium]